MKKKNFVLMIILFLLLVLTACSEMKNVHSITLKDGEGLKLYSTKSIKLKAVSEDMFILLERDNEVHVAEYEDGLYRVTILEPSKRMTIVHATEKVHVVLEGSSSFYVEKELSDVGSAVIITGLVCLLVVLIPLLLIISAN